MKSDSTEINTELILRVMHGDIHAFEQVLSFYEKSIFNYCRRITKNSDDAKDITQETFIKVYLHRKNIQPDKNIKTWIFTIATHTAYDLLRKRKRRNEETLDEKTETIAGTTAYYIVDGLNSDIEKALDLINEDYKKALLLYYNEGFGYQEIADITATPINTIKTNIHRGREQLKEILKNYGTH